MELVAKNIYNGLDVYQENIQEVYSRQQIGRALGYKNPKRAIGFIHDRHKEELDKYSGVFTLNTPGGRQEAFAYSARGVIRICAYSSQPRAKELLFIITDRMQKTIESQQSIIASQQAEIARQNSDFTSVHQLNKEIKAENVKLAVKANLQATPEGRAAKTMHDAIKAAICTERYGIYRERSRMHTSREIIGVYDKSYLYVPMDRLLMLYNGYGANKISFSVLRSSLGKVGFIAKNPTCRSCKRIIGGDRTDCERIPLKYVNDIISTEL